MLCSFVKSRLDNITADLDAQAPKLMPSASNLVTASTMRRSYRGSIVFEILIEVQVLAVRDLKRMQRFLEKLIMLAIYPAGASQDRASRLIQLVDVSLGIGVE